MRYTVKLKNDNTVFEVDENETILDAALSQGVRLPYGCKNAQCFGCLQEIEHGEVEYRREIKDVGDLLKYQTMLCQAYAKSDVVLSGQQLPDLTVDTVATDAQSADMQSTSTHTQAKEPSLSADQQEGTDKPARPPITVSTFPVKVVKNNKLDDEVHQVELALPERITFAFIPGQYLDVLLENGERRSFSIAHYDEEKKVITIYIKYITGGFFSDYVFSHLTLGTIWTIEAPLGPFILQDSERPVLMIATSTGISPLFAMLDTQAQQHESRQFLLYWGVRYPSYLFLDAALDELATKLPNLQYTPVVSRPTDEWAGRAGYPQHAAIEDIKDLSAFDIYISGGQALIDDAVASCLAAGAVRTQIYLDVFSFQSQNR
ncbi:2Fe-2S iron-sulfur cluster-binding protein [Ostreibacterium oceani]|uniref:2Fe-2S iron-sulfur cluster binding domain-containing protein n=1 Tax=Ostreibacterium oceani TaxID=2654998 RepID=A0A6N7EZJ9_9GAMM|nr:2Fe-2S iron-sulfur cluster-binding protein [Ostreibacterium oceani]MPV86789.1 2Fe-2S iron-sulfur cluster binding domain-containing protein [Ostreibacterium oceani]